MPQIGVLPNCASARRISSWKSTMMAKGRKVRKAESAVCSVSRSNTRAR